jgi:hypothetical protein
MDLSATGPGPVRAHDNPKEAELQIPAQLSIELRPRVGSDHAVARVYVQLDLLVADKVVANLPLGLTDADGRLSVSRATLQAMVDEDILRRGTTARQAYVAPGPLGRLSVIGGKHFNWLFTTGVVARTLDTQTQGWLAQASNAELASEWVRLDLTEKPVTVVVPLVPKGGVNSERIEQHARSFRAAVLAMGLIATLLGRIGAAGPRRDVCFPAGAPMVRL